MMKLYACKDSIQSVIMEIMCLNEGKKTPTEVCTHARKVYINTYSRFPQRMQHEYKEGNTH